MPAVLFYRNLRKLKYLLDFHPLRPSFADHASRGVLPNYAVIEQHYLDSKLDPANDDHPSHDVYQGQMLVKYVYETLRASPQWNQTLLVITYDGFFDLPPNAWAGTFEGMVQTGRTEPRTDCLEQLPTPTRIRETEADEEAKLSEFQQEIIKLVSVLNGDHHGRLEGAHGRLGDGHLGLGGGHGQLELHGARAR